MEQRLGCHFANSQLLLQSLAHRSYLNENPNFRLGSNERLEFLGDAVLAYVCAEYLYQRFPTLQEGELTALRAAAVKADTLAKFANQLQLGQYLLLGRGEAKGGGRTRPLLLSSGFEAVIGALLLDAGLPPARELIVRFLAPELELIVAESRQQNHKSLLQELAQGQRLSTPEYQTRETSGPEHAREFTVQVLVGGQLAGSGGGRSKQQAQQAAACDALEHTTRWLSAAAPS
ncbi:MAG: ribonuclease III [Chloroflexota bacterium]